MADDVLAVVVTLTFVSLVVVLSAAITKRWGRHSDGHSKGNDCAGDGPGPE